MMAPNWRSSGSLHSAFGDPGRERLNTSLLASSSEICVSVNQSRALTHLSHQDIGHQDIGLRVGNDAGS
jgi:hypothetical protein